jgi:glycerate-2-kinase
MERLSAAASALEATAARLEERAELSGDVQKITAAVEGSGDVGRRTLELERKLAAAEQEIAELLAAGVERRGTPERQSAARKTLPAATVQLLAKQGIDSLDTMDTPTLDAALAGLSIEQRLAVKSQLLRSGAVIS